MNKTIYIEIRNVYGLKKSEIGYFVLSESSGATFFCLHKHFYSYKKSEGVFIMKFRGVKDIEYDERFIKFKNIFGETLVNIGRKQLYLVVDNKYYLNNVPVIEKNASHVSKSAIRTEFKSDFDSDSYYCGNCKTHHSGYDCPNCGTGKYTAHLRG